MPDLHLATIGFLKSLLKAKQLEMARAAHSDDFAQLETEFELLRHRLMLEIAYGAEAED